MPEVITCPACQRKLQLPSELLGRKVQCPTCSQTFVPSADGQGPLAGPRAKEAVPVAVPVLAPSLQGEKPLPELQLPPDESYQKTVWIFALGGGLLVAGICVALFFRAVARDRLTLSILLLVGPLCGFLVGMVGGFGAACLLAPDSFYETPRGRRWLRRIGTQHALVARVACLILVGFIAVLLLVLSFVVWLL